MKKIDLLCDNYKRAAKNRRMVKLKQNISEYVRIEAIVKSTPKNKRLPDQFYGQIPLASKNENLYSFHEFDDC